MTLNLTRTVYKNYEHPRMVDYTLAENVQTLLTDSCGVLATFLRKYKQFHIQPTQITDIAGIQSEMNDVSIVLAFDLGVDVEVDNSDVFEIDLSNFVSAEISFCSSNTLDASIIEYCGKWHCIVFKQV